MPPIVQSQLGGGISKTCCESNGYYYFDEYQNIEQVQQCYVCPPFTLTTTSPTYLQGSITFGGVNYNTINDYNNQPLSKECCIYVNQESPLNYTWNVNIGCYEL
jgi:hypothetical protein